MFQGWLMSRDEKIAEISGDSLTPIQNKLLPLFFECSNSLTDWLNSRAMDYKSRPNARMLRKVLRISGLRASEMVRLVNAACLTDTYWVKPADSELTYQDVRFHSNEYWRAALFGPKLSDFSASAHFSRTPELTSPGSFEKGWRLDESGVWWLYKAGKPEHIFSEMAAFLLARRLHYPTAIYEVVNETTIRSRDFTNGASVNFEPAFSLEFSSDDVIENYGRLLKMSPELAYQYAQIVTLDTLIANADRHNGNWGFLRDISTGEIISMAPNYDNNLSLLAIEHDKMPGVDAFIKEWQNMVLFYHVPVRFPLLTADDIRAMLEPVPVPVDKVLAVSILSSRMQTMHHFLLEHQNTLYQANPLPDSPELSGGTTLCRTP